MRTTKEPKVEQLAKTLGRLSPNEAKSLVEILDRENLKARRARVRREVTNGKVVTERQLFKDLD